MSAQVVVLRALLLLLLPCTAILTCVTTEFLFLLLSDVFASDSTVQGNVDDHLNLGASAARKATDNSAQQQCFSDGCLRLSISF